jgi:uncharacterized repeat protein (TIGR01451 family)
MTLEEATSTLTGAGFTVSPDNVFVVDSTITPGTVLSTSPPFGESAVQGTVVVLTVSQAPADVAVPDLTGATGEAGKAFLEAEPYTFAVTVTQEPSTTIPANIVIRTDPAVGTPLAKGSAITLVVSAGPAKVRVPPVETLTEEAARNQLTNRGLVADVQFVTVAIGSPDDGHVISQSIPPTESVNPGTTIRLKVGKAAAAPTTTSSTTLPPTTTSPPSADLSINMTGGPSGTSVTYTIVVGNAGPSTTNGATVTTTMPSPMTSVTWVCGSATGGASCPASGSGNGNINDTVNLPSGGSVTFTVRGTVSATATGPFKAQASVTPPSGVTDPSSANNEATKNDTLPSP